MYTIITPTGNRQQSFNLLTRYILRQNPQPAEWIIVDDGSPKTTVYDVSFAKYIRREPSTNDPHHTICLNMLEAIKHVTTDKIFIFEDDDWYSSSYVENLLPILDNYDIIGGRPTLHYGLKHRQYKFYDTARLKTCLCRTAFKKSVLPIFEQVCREGSPTIDINLWKYAIERGYKGFIRKDGDIQHIGFKGVLGREGRIGMHARALSPQSSFSKDSNLEMLTKWIGNDVNNYNNMYR